MMSRFGVDRDRRGLRRVRGVALGEVDADRHHAGVRGPGDRGVHLERFGQRADQQHPVARAAPAADQVQDPAGDEAQQQDVDQAGDERDSRPTTRDRSCPSSGEREERDESRAP